MELLRTTNNKPWGSRNKNEKNVEFLRDLCLLDIDDNMNWTLFLNDEAEKGSSLTKLRKLIQDLIKQKEQRRKNKTKQRRLVIWTSRLNLFYVYCQFLDKGLNTDIINKFREGRYEEQVMDVYNQNLEFRNFELISGEMIEDINNTYSFGLTNRIGIMKAFIEMRQEQGLKDWTQLRYTFANNSLKLFYREAGFSEQTKSRMRYEGLKRKPSLPLSQIYDQASKAGVLLINKNIMGKVIENVYAEDINEAYNSQFVRCDDFPIGKIYKTELNQFAALVKANKWFLLVMVSEYEIEKMPPWIKPYKFDDGNYYYIIEQYDYIGLTKIGLKITTIDKEWKKYKLYTCDEVGYLDWFFRKRIVKRYGQRRYLKKLGDPREKIIKAQFKFLYGKGLQKRNFSSNREIDEYYHQDNSYVNQIIAYHAMAKNRVEILEMLNRLDQNYVSCDTDGIKTQHPNAAAIFAQRNNEIKEENAKAGFINTEIGLWKHEGLYPRFIQFGNKVYAYEDSGELVCKFAGCLKSAWKEYFKGDDLEVVFYLLESCDIAIPKGIVKRSLQLNEHKEFYVKKEIYSYGINGIDKLEG